METLLSIFLFMSIPDIVFAPVAVGGYALYEDLKTDMEIEDAIKADCEIYVKDYTDCNPEWKWGYTNGILNFHEMIGAPLEVLERDVFGTSLKKLQKTDSIPSSDYTLLLYFRENICVKAVYWRPMDKQFLACYGKGEDTSFHVYSEYYGDKKKDFLIDLNITYYNFINVVLLKQDPQMVITAKFCGDKFKGISSIFCSCKEYKY